MNKYKQHVFFIPLALFFVLIPLPVRGGIIFSEPDLSSDNQLLFRAGSGIGGIAVQDALFLTRLESSGFGGSFALQQLTVFPEKIDLLDSGRTLQIRNAFGAMRLPLSGGLPMPIPGLPSFAGGSPAAAGSRAEEMAPSSDGRWLLYLDPVSAALGNLVMLDVQTGARIPVASALERPEQVFPASWSPDSRFFIYERDGKLYYYMTGSSFMGADERTRFIGEGAISSISWGRGGDFFYLRGSILYMVRGLELFARAMYADFLEIGVVAGRLPFEFDPWFDHFWAAPDASSLLVSKGRRSLFYFPLSGEEATETALPFFLLPKACSGIDVLWPVQGPVTVVVSVPDFAGIDVKCWRLEALEGGKVAFEQAPPPGPGRGSGSFPNGSVSPNGNLALFWGSGGILLYDYQSWKLLGILSALPGASCLWITNNEFIAADEQRIDFLRLDTENITAAPGSFNGSFRAPICLSHAGQFGFEEGSQRILAKSGDSWFVTDGRNPWAPIINPQLRKSSQVSAQYRVYLERQGPGIYNNLPMIRNTVSVGTFPLFPPAALSIANSNDARPAPREAALCFDLYDDDRGLPEILNALNRYGIKATFFLNGEFIRRYPLAVADLAQAGHEIASMFYALIDLSDSRYRAGSDFIAQGLARNEDEYFRVTGKELVLLWHPPWYMISHDIAAAAAMAGYVTSGRDIDIMDWVSREDEKSFGIPQRSPSEMIDYVMEAVRPGSIIPVRLGLLPGGRNGYLFNRINVLIDALVREGYSLTTVTALMEYRTERY